MIKATILILSLLTISGISSADTVKKYADKNIAADFKFSGYVDGSYNYLVRSNQFTSGSFDRVFDLTPDGFTLQQAALTLAYQPKKGFGTLINPVIGRDPYTFSPYGWNPNYGSQWLGFALPQAYVQYVYNALTISAGNFVELAGAESLFPVNNSNFSRSIIFGFAEPFTVTGTRAAYVVNDKLNFIVGLNNGWDSIRDFSRRKTLELNVNYAPTSMYSFAATLYSGSQRATGRTSTGSESIRNALDLIATINATDKLTFIANYDYVNQTLAALPGGSIAGAVWHGLAGYINYKFDDKWKTSFRAEIFSDRNGYSTGIVQCWKELTLTIGYTLMKNFELRAEARHDFSNVNSFINANNISANNNQQSYALEAYYKFG